MRDRKTKEGRKQKKHTSGVKPGAFACTAIHRQPIIKVSEMRDAAALPLMCLFLRGASVQGGVGTVVNRYVYERHLELGA